MTRRVAFLVACAIGVSALAIYSPGLDRAPVYLSPDEAIISVDAHSIASTGRDVLGRFMPLYFEIHDEDRVGWFTPVVFYWSALLLKVLPFDERSVRFATVCVGVADIVLIYFVARQLFAAWPLAVVASALLAMSPAHFIFSRLALDYLYPVPFILVWLLLLIRFLRCGRTAYLFGAGLALGIGFYSYIAAVLMMPLYLAVTALVLWQARSSWRRVGPAAAAGFGLPLLFVAVWLTTHPTAFADTVRRYDLYDARHLTFLQGVRSFLSAAKLGERASLYWQFFDPQFLFFTGDRQMIFSTRSAGVFLLAVAPLLAMGLYHLVSRAPRPTASLLLLGLATAPVAAVLVPQGGAMNRAVEVLPFAVLAATYGVHHLWDHGLLGRVVAVLLLMSMPWEFRRFAADYYGDYRVRSAPWFEGNIRGALEDLIARSPRGVDRGVFFAPLTASAGQLDGRNRWMGTYWTFYATKHDQRDLLERTASFDRARVDALPAGSLVLANVGSAATEPLVAEGALTRAAVIPELSGPPFFSILQRP